MLAGAPRLTQRARFLLVRHAVGERNRRIAAKRSQRALDPFRIREAAIEQRQAFNSTAVHVERSLDDIDTAERERLKLRLKSDRPHLAREPLTRRAVDLRSGAMKALALVGADEFADTLLHVLLVGA